MRSTSALFGGGGGGGGGGVGGGGYERGSSSVKLAKLGAIWLKRDIVRRSALSLRDSADPP